VGGSVGETSGDALTGESLRADIERCV
jgi:hypothetical protein